MTNLFGQDPWERRGENEARIRALETQLALINTDGGVVWSPVVTQSNTPAQTVSYATYIRIGRLIVAHWRTVFTAAGTATNDIVLTGFPADAADVYAISGAFRYFDTGTTNHAGTITGATTSTAKFVYEGFGNNMGNGDLAIANTDVIQGVLILQTAS